MGGRVAVWGLTKCALRMTHAEATNKADWDDNEDSAMEDESGVDCANKGEEAEKVEATTDTEKGQREEEAYETM